MLQEGKAKETPSSEPAAAKGAGAPGAKGAGDVATVGVKSDGDDRASLIPSWGVEWLLIVVLGGLALWILIFAARQIADLCFSIRERYKGGVSNARSRGDPWGPEQAVPRDRIALTMASVGGAIVLILILVAAYDVKNEKTLNLILTAALPLVGTWVGTVLAFYFGRENYEAAARSTLRAMKGDSEIPVVDRMTPLAEMKVFQLEAGPQDKLKLDVPLVKIRAEMGDKYLRMPLMKPGNKVASVLHEQLVVSFLSDKALEGVAQADLAKLTIEDLFKNPKCKAKAEAIAFVKKSGTVADAKAAMEGRPGGCQDVFVTENGREQEPVLGWLTNNNILRFTE